MKRLLTKIFSWIFSERIKALDKSLEIAAANNRVMGDKIEFLQQLVGNMHVGIDVHENDYSPNWAVICIQGEKANFIKFMRMRDNDLREIQHILRSFERFGARDYQFTIDAAPQTSRFLKATKGKF